MIYPHPTDAAKSIMQDGNQVTIWEGDLEDIAKNITILREGKIKNFTGIDAPFDNPKNPDLELFTDKHTIDEITDIVIEKILPLITL